INPRTSGSSRPRAKRRVGVSKMGKLLKVVALSMAVCAAAPAQNPVIKPPIVGQDLSNNPLLTPRPLPTPRVPDLTRLGVAGGRLPLALVEAIRLALENNNDIEVSRDNVRLADTTLRSLQGVYDPIFDLNTVRLTEAILPQPRESNNFIIDHWPIFTDVNIPAINVPGGTNASGRITERDITLSPSLTKQLSAGGGQYRFFFDNQ